MKNNKLSSYGLWVMLFVVLVAINAVAQTGRGQTRHLESQQQRVVQPKDQRQMPQRQAQSERRDRQERWDDPQERRDDQARWDERRGDRQERWDDHNDGQRVADKFERTRERQEMQRIRQLDRQRQLRYQHFGNNRVVGYFDRFGKFQAVGYYDRFGNFWRYR